MIAKKISTTILTVILVYALLFSTVPISASAASGPNTIDLSGFDFGTNSSDTNWSFDQGTKTFTITDDVSVIGSNSLMGIAFNLNGNELKWEATFTGTAQPILGIIGNGTFNLIGGSITNTSSGGAAIHISGDATAIISGGVINAGNGGLAISGADATHTPNNIVIIGDVEINGIIDVVTMTINSGVTLTTNSLTILDSYCSLTNNGTINNTGTITNNGTLTNNGTVNNPAGSTILNDADIINSSSGVIDNAGTITNNVTLNNSGTIVNDGGSYTGTAPTGNTPLTGISFSAVQTGGTNGTADSTGINLIFSQAVIGLTASDITISNDTGAAVKGTLSGSGTSWNIGLLSVTTQGNVTVSIDDFNSLRITNSPQSVAIFKDQTIAPTITSTTLPNGTVGTAYNQTLAATGTAPIAWTVDSGSLPDGLSLAGATGIISGTPTVSGTFSFTVIAANGILPNATQALSIEIVPDPTDTSISSVAGQSTTTWTGTGADETNAKTAAISVVNSMTSIVDTDVVTATGATATVYTDAAFTTAGAVTLSVGDNDVYIKVVAADTTTTVFYHLTVTRQSNSSGSGGSGSSGGYAPTSPTGSFNGSSLYTQGTITGIIYIVNKDFAQFDKVMVDNNTLTQNTQYTAENSSTMITLLPEYLDTLTAGTHSLRVGFKDNTSATVQFTVTEAAVSPIPFNDVAVDAWYYEAVKYVFEKDLMVGTADDVFSPNTTLTRGMIVTILHRRAGEPDAAGLENPFDDVAEGIWYTEAIKWAAANGIVMGYDNGNFGPNDPVTKEQLATLIYRTQIADGIIPLNVGGTAIFEADSMSEWAVSFVDDINMQGIFNDIPSDDLYLKDPASRADVASMLYKWLMAIEN